MSSIEEPNVPEFNPEKLEWFRLKSKAEKLAKEILEREKLAKGKAET